MRNEEEWHRCGRAKTADGGASASPRFTTAQVCVKPPAPPSPTQCVVRCSYEAEGRQRVARSLGS